MAVEIDRAWPVHTTKPSGVQNSLALAGLIARNSDGTVRTGILPPTPDPNLVQARTDMRVNVLPFQAVSSRTGQGAVLIANAATRVLALTAAPSANSRIDVVYAQAQDGAPPNSDPLYADPVNTGTDPYTGKPFQYSKTIIEVATGVAAGVPSKPSLPAGAVELATITVASGSTATNSSGVAITQTYQYTVGAGGTLPYANEAALKADIMPGLGQQAVSTYSGIEWTMTQFGWVCSAGALPVWAWRDSYDGGYTVSSTAKTEAGSSSSFTLTAPTLLRARLATCLNATGATDVEVQHQIVITGPKSLSVPLCTPKLTAAWGAYSNDQIIGSFPAGNYTASVTTAVLGSVSPVVHKNKVVGSDGNGGYSRVFEIYTG